MQPEVQQPVYTCPFCGKRFKRLMYLKAHIRKVHGDVDACPCCGKELHGLWGLVQHCGWHLDDPCHATIYYLYLSPNTSKEAKRKVRKVKAIADEQLRNGILLLHNPG